jgi:hypothetical protein
LKIKNSFVKYIIFILSVLFTLNSVFAQIYVKDNSFIFNNGTVVYAKGNLELNGANSNFYLRNGGQFLQGTTSTSTNQGIGKLSVFQEGTVNNFAYNYWCSPVGNASAVSGNEDFGITMFTIPTTSILSTAATISSATYNGSSSAGALTIASYWIFKFLSQSTYSGWVQSGAATNIAAGQGFTMKGTSGSDATNVGETTVNNPGSAQRYDFRGKPNDGNITVNVATDNYTLTGNPYPSALHVNAFLLDGSNTACNGIAYFWEQKKTVNSHVLLSYQGGYGTYSPVSLVSNGIYVPATFGTYNIDGTLNVSGASSGLVIERKYAPIGQGFMVKGLANGTITLKNSHRDFKKEGNFSQFERNSNSQHSDTVSPIGVETISQIRLNTIVNNQYTKQMALAFIPESTDGVDRGIDAISPVADDLPYDVYFFLDNNKYIIQGVNFDINKRIPIGIKSTDNSSFEFNVSTIVNFDPSQDIFIYDSQEGTYHDIKNDTYIVILPTGTYNNRFEITFKNDALSASNPIKENVVVFQNNTNQLLTVSNPNLLELKSVTLFDLSGKKIFSHLNLGTNSSYAFTTGALSDGVYLAKIQCSGGKNKVQKIIVTSN